MTLGQAYNIIRNHRILDNGTTRTPTQTEIQKARNILRQAGHRIEDIEPPTLSGMLNEGIGALQGAADTVGDFFAPAGRAIKQGYMDFMKDGPIYPTPDGQAIPPAPEPDPFDTLEYQAFAAEQGEQDRLQGMRNQARRSAMPMTMGEMAPPAQAPMTPPMEQSGMAPPVTPEVTPPIPQSLPPMAQEPLMEPPVFRAGPSPRDRKLAAAKATYGLGGPTALEDNLLPSEIEMRAIRKKEAMYGKEIPKEDENETYNQSKQMEEITRDDWLAQLEANAERLSSEADMARDRAYKLRNQRTLDRSIKISH